MLGGTRSSGSRLARGGAQTAEVQVSVGQQGTIGLGFTMIDRVVINVEGELLGRDLRQAGVHVGTLQRDFSVFQFQTELEQRLIWLPAVSITFNYSAIQQFLLISDEVLIDYSYDFRDRTLNSRFVRVHSNSTS